MEGKWKECYHLIEEMKVWKGQAEFKQDTLEGLKEKIKECGLLAYIMMSRQCYNSFSIKTLSELFELDSNAIVRVISKVRK